LAIFFTFVDKGEIRIYIFRFLIGEEVRVRDFVGQSYRKARAISKADKAVSGYDTEPEQQLYDIK